MIKAVFDSIIVKPLEVNEGRHGSIIVPDTGKEKALYGTVISVGPGRHSISGGFIPSVIKEGQTVMLPLMGPVKIEHEREEYYGCPETMVLAIVG